MGNLFSFLSVLCYIFAVADIVLFYIFDVDLTGVSWSPIAAGGLGAILGYFGGNDSE